MLALAGDAEDAAHDDGQPGHAAFAGGDHQPCAGALNALLFGFEADHEAGLIGERDQRQVEGVAELDQADHFVAGGDIGRAARVDRVVGHHAHRIAVDPGEAGDAGAPVERSDLEERSLIDDGVDRLVPVVGAAAVAGHEAAQPLVAAVGVVGGLDARRQFPDVGWQVGEPLADLAEGVFLGFGEVVDGAALVDVYALVAEVLFADVVAQRGADDRRAAGEELADSFDHQGEVGHAGVDGGQPGDRAHDGGDDGRGAQEVHIDSGPSVAIGQVGAADLLEAADAAAGRVEHADVGQAPLERALVGGRLAAKSAFRAAAGAAAHGEVTGADDDLAPVDLAEALHRTLGSERSELALIVVGGAAGEAPELAEAAGVGEAVDPFVDEQFAAPPLARDAFSSAARFGQLAAVFEFGDLGFPAHRSHLLR